MKEEVDKVDLHVPNSHYGLCGCKATSKKSSGAVTEKVDLGSPSLTVTTVFVGPKQH